MSKKISSKSKFAKPITGRARKEKVVAEISEKAERANALVFANYQGMTHKQIEELKKALKKVDAELVVAKNTLVKIALDKTKQKQENLDSLQGPTITLFSFSDIIAPLKELAKTVKAINLPVVKFGIFPAKGGSASGREGEILSADQIMQLSILPSREILLAQVVGGLKSPIFGLHRAMSWNLQKLVLTLKAVETKKV